MDTTDSRAFAARLASLLREEHHAMADFLVALAEFDRRRGWVALGYSGLFPFLHRELGLSKAASFFRKTAAELVQRFPEVVEPLRDGRLCLTTVASLAKVLTRENRAEILPRFFHRSGLEAKAVVAELVPASDPPTRTLVTVTPVRVAQVQAPEPEPAVEVRTCEPPCPEGTYPGHASASPLPAPPRRLEIVPLTPTETRLHMTISPAFLQKLEAARLALSHSMPGASAEDVLSAGLDLLLERAEKRKGLVARPRPSPPEERARPGAAHVPAAVKREVWKRDGGSCQWPTDDGGVCGSRLRVQLDHLVMRVEGGRPVPENLRLLCDLHNRLAARQRLGDRTMDRYCRNPGQADGPGPGEALTGAPP
jgi:hypothetical protein